MAIFSPMPLIEPPPEGRERGGRLGPLAPGAKALLSLLMDLKSLLLGAGELVGASGAARMEPLTLLVSLVLFMAVDLPFASARSLAEILTVCGHEECQSYGGPKYCCTTCKYKPLGTVNMQVGWRPCTLRRRPVRVTTMSFVVFEGYESAHHYQEPSKVANDAKRTWLATLQGSCASMCKG
jgi:hypothetical protein